MILESQGARVEVRPQGAQVLSWVPADGRDRLWVSPRANRTPGASLRGGIPLCVPWFADRHQPLHGFGRHRLWDATGPVFQDGTSSVLFSLEDDDESRLLWPHAFRFEHEVTLGRDLTLTFRAWNRGHQPAPLEFVWHTYFAVQNLSAVRLLGLEGRSFLDKNRQRTPGTQVGPLEVNEALDLVFPQVSAVQVLTEGPLSLTITSNAPGAVVWNVGDRDGLVDDLGAGAHQHYLCVERGFLDHRVLLAPGVPWEVSMTLSDPSLKPFSGEEQP